LSTFYTACNWAGAGVFYKEKSANRPSFDRRQWTLVSLLSVFTALNTLIGRANIAVPTTFDQQVMQAVGPLLVLLITTRVFKRSVSRARKLAAAPIVVGVALTWFGEMELSVAAAAVSISCVALNASKVVIYSEMLSGDYKVTPLHLLSRVSPMTLVQVGMFALFRGEVSGMVGQWREILTGWSLHVIAVTGVVSFAMTVLSMHATKFATPLTVSVMGALKQIFVVAFSVVRMRRPISRLNIIGVVLVAIGAVRYAIVSAKERKLREKRGVTSAGAGKNKADALAKGDGYASSGPLLPTATVAVVVPSGTMVNGKGPLKKGKAEREGRAGGKKT
ncbi:unnamed protein product, partial [Laminaria digitata]